VRRLADHEVIAADEHAQRLDSEAVSRSQRLTFLGIAVLIAVVAVVILVGSGGDEGTTTSSQATPTPTAQAGATETATPTATPTPRPPLVTGEGIAKLRFKQGDTVRFRVRSSIPEEVHVHGYDLMKDVTPGQTVTFSFKATITGIFEIEYEHAGRQIAQLRVDP
jgi:FtsP/CotA-like multicopper oxidase with cupredoxin domain